MRAGVFAENSISGKLEYGPWSLPLVFNTFRSNANIQKLWNDQQAILLDLYALEDQRRKAYETYMKTALVCLSHNAEHEAQIRSKMAVVEIILYIPSRIFHQVIGWIMMGVKALPGGTQLIQGSEWTMKQADEKIEALCNAKGNGTKLLKGICTAGKGLRWFAKSMIAGMNPVQSLGEFSNAIHNVMHPEDAIAMACSAEAILDKTLTAVQDQQMVKENEFKNAKQALIDAGELTKD
jgi:hypothetical protein